MTSLPLYPLQIERQFIYRMWGGQRIAEWLHLPEPRPTHIGETWEIYDTNTIRNGALAGQTLAQVTQQYQEHLVGTTVLERYGADFPLLLKFIDANDKLSIQVHPDDAYALAHEAGTGFYGKTEAWYVLDATPGAHVIYGLNEPMSRERFAEAVETKTLENYVNYVPLHTGEVVFTPAGTLHAINAGVLLFEIQQKSDLTYRVYDYGREDPKTGQQRPLHLDKALDVLRLAPSPCSKTTPVPLHPDHNGMLLVACKHFALELWTLGVPKALCKGSKSMALVTLIGGHGTMQWATGQITLQTGDSVVIPACVEQCRFIPETAQCRILRAYVPDIEHDVIVPLQSQGVSDDRIAQVLCSMK